MSQIAFRIPDLDCAEEVAILKRELGPLVGEEALGFDVLQGKLTVSGSSLGEEELRAAVARTGMTAEPWRSAQAQDGERSRHRNLQGALTLLSGLALVAGFATHATLAGSAVEALGHHGGHAHEGVPLAARVIYTLAIVTGAWMILPKALFALRRLRPDMNLLMTVAVAGAVGIGEWFEGATVAFLFALSNALEAWSVGRARRAVESLMDLSPTTARLRSESGEEVMLPAAEVAVGSFLWVHPGEKIPLDGRVSSGTSEVDQAPITGESQPVTKETGDEVFAGTVNGSGVLEVEATRAAEDTTLAHIVRLVEQARSRRAPSERWVERFARIYTPVVMGLALAVALVPPLVSGGSWEVWFYRALVLLVIGCPCALVISTPVSVVASLASAARHGVLIKGGAFVELPARLKAIAFDKTGTLTRGEPSVVEVVPLAEHDEAELLARAVALEARSPHPIARAILRYAREKGVSARPAEKVQAIPGKGIGGLFQGKPFWLGSHRYLEERNQETPEIHARLEAMSDAGQTVVVVGNDTHVCGFIAVADGLRPEAREVVERLRDGGIPRLLLLTGDNRGTAQAVAREAGLDDVRAELLPADKVAAVEALTEAYGEVAMVGDGVNDAPAMARASLGIAMGSAGSDAAIESADIALMADDLGKLPWLVRHSHRTLSIIRQNIVFALGLKLAVFLLATAGYASLWMAIAADMGASLLVIANGLRLLKG